MLKHCLKCLEGVEIHHRKLFRVVVRAAGRVNKPIEERSSLSSSIIFIHEGAHSGDPLLVEPTTDLPTNDNVGERGGPIVAMLLDPIVTLLIVYFIHIIRNGTLPSSQNDIHIIIII